MPKTPQRGWEVPLIWGGDNFRQKWGTIQVVVVIVVALVVIVVIIEMLIDM